MASEVAVTPTGETGMLRTASAITSPTRRVHLGLALDFSSVSGLFTSDDHVTRWLSTLSIATTPWHFIEFWLNARASSTSNNQTTPKLSLSQGGLQFGTKGSYSLLPPLTVGIDFQVGLRTRIGNTGYDLAATELRARGLASLDLQSLPTALPIQTHINFGIIIDNSRNLSEESDEFTLPQRYALDVYDFHRLFFGAGLEFLLGRWRPYLEYSLEYPLDYSSTQNLVVAENRSERSPLLVRSTESTPKRIMPQRLTPGIRYYLLDNLSLHLAIELGLSPDQALGVPTVPAYNVVSFISYRLERKTATSRTTSPSSIAPSWGSIVGHVQDKRGNHPIADVIVEISSAPPTVTSSTGIYHSMYLKPGPVKLSVRKKGYQSQHLSTHLQANETLQLSFSLIPLEPLPLIKGNVYNQDGEPIPNAQLQWNVIPTHTSSTAPVEGHSQKATPTSMSSTVFTTSDGRFQISLAPAEWQVIVSHPTYLRTGQSIPLTRATATPEYSFTLIARASIRPAKVVNQRILLPEPVQYAGHETAVRRSMLPSLAALLDLLHSQTDLAIKVCGHTDSRGSPADNQRISELRAANIKSYLIEHGVIASRIRTVGYGSSRPVAPNLTRAGRAQNHRVDIHLQHYPPAAEMTP